MTRRFGILRRCGLMKRREEWGNPSDYTFEREPPNGCGLVLSVRKNMLEIDVEKVATVVEIVVSFSSM